MRFWDSSAIVPLIVAETSSVAVRALLADDSEVVVWWSTEIECLSALARREREKNVSSDESLAAAADLAAFAARIRDARPAHARRCHAAGIQADLSVGREIASYPTLACHA